jgi:diguanylate cyclase (GGDEF)-like protein/PAS domain S-box-containing protein
MLDGTLNLLMASSFDTSNCIKNALKTHFPDFYIHRVDTKHALSQALEDKQWNLIFSEMELSDFSANELPEIFEQYELNIPVALIAGRGSEKVASRCLEYGTCQLIQCDQRYLHHLPATISALLKRAETKRQKSLAEQQLLESEERYLDIFNNTSDLIQCILPDGSFIYTNNAWRKAMGYSQEEVQLLNLMDVLHPETKNCCQDRFARLQAGENLPAIDFEFITKSGETLHLFGECGSIVKNGAVTSTRGIFRNVTETVRVEQALKDSEKRYQSLYDLAPDIYTIMNNNGTILSLNQTGADVLGYSKEEVIGQSVENIIHPEDQQRVIAHITELFNSEKDDESIEYRKVRKDGSVLWVHQCAKLDQDDGEPRLLVVSRDITERRELQEKLTFHATHDSLTQLINRRELESRLKRVLSDMSEHDYHVLCFLDLDNFKIINDVNGHAAGDELLRQVTGILRENIRSRDTLARIGGDEFVVLMEHCQLSVAVKLAEKIQKIIDEFEFNWHEQVFSIGVSIGVTRLQADKTVELVLSTADAACYKAKKNGRSCIHLDESM